MRRHPGGLLGATIALVGLAIAGYLSVVKLAGQLPACGPLRGCETVALSEFSDIAGIPVALLGVVFSVSTLALQLIWWRSGDRRAVLAAYGMGVFGMLFVSWLTYLELFVIHAVCAWCVAYAVTIVAGWLVAAAALRRD